MLKQGISRPTRDNLCLIASLSAHVFVSSGSCNKILQSGELNSTHLLSQLWRLEDQDQGVSRWGFS